LKVLNCGIREGATAEECKKSEEDKEELENCRCRGGTAKGESGEGARGALSVSIALTPGGDGEGSSTILD
jgi:hypothetical protein